MIFAAIALALVVFALDAFAVAAFGFVTLPTFRVLREVVAFVLLVTLRLTFVAGAEYAKFSGFLTALGGWVRVIFGLRVRLSCESDRCKKSIQLNERGYADT